VKSVFWGRLCLPVICVLVWLSGADPVFAGMDKPFVAGWSERVLIYPSGMIVNAKLDSGAKTSSINARGVEQFQKDGQDWVRFQFKNTRGEKTIIEQPVVRVVRIKDLGRKPQVRQVIRLGVCLGRYFKEAEFTLSNRKGFAFPLLLGRRFLDDKVLVASAKRRITTPDCKEGISR